MSRRLDSVNASRFRTAIGNALGGVVKDPFTVWLAERYMHLSPEDQHQIERQVVLLCKKVPISALQALELLYKVSPYLPTDSVAESRMGTDEVQKYKILGHRPSMIIIDEIHGMEK